MPAFDQVSVISDLHMGGLEGCQIFGQGALLAAFIDDLRANSPTGSALVINGDMVDFLAEPCAKAFDPAGAIAKLERIAGDKAFKPVWDALRRYAQSRSLVVTLGNHDLELALPWVKQRFLGLLTDGDSKAIANVTLSFDGSGFACAVGNSKALCLHGNEVDTWNVTDHETLRRIGCDLVQGRTAADWIPNAGAKLVVEVMNDIKKDHAFVDLLKPETQVAVRVLLVLKPDLRARLRAVAEVASKRVWDGVRRAVGWLSVEQDADAPTAPDALVEVVGPVGMKVDPEKLLDRAEARFRDTNPIDIVYEQQNQQLGWWDGAVSLIRGREPHEIALAAIDEVASQKAFEVGHIDDDFRRIDELVGGAYDLVVAGHTHLARVLNRDRGRGRYFNSGTWASLMQLAPEQLSSPESFEPVFEALRKSTTIAQLGELVWNRPTVVTIRRQGAEAEASLDLVSLKAGQVALTPLTPAKP